VILLSPDNPTEALNSFLTKKASLITRKIFDVSLRFDFVAFSQGITDFPRHFPCCRFS
jgi:hypothetical protein